MTRKLLMIGIALIGITLAFGSNAWAERGRGGKGGKGNRHDKAYHHNAKSPSGHHYGWEKGKGNPHRDRYQSRPDYRHRDRNYRNGRHPRKRVVEKHVYHHTRRPVRHHDARFNIAFSVIDNAFGAVVAVGGRR